MYNSISFYCFIAFLNCNLKNVFSEETIPVRPNFTGKYTSGITNYEVVIPQRVNEDGSLISHVVSHRHSKRSTKELEFIFYKIPIGGKDYLIELTPNRKLISPGAVIEIHKENVRKSANRKSLNGSSNNETIGDMFRNLDIRKLKNTDCYFSGTVKGENASKAALSTCFGLAGFIQISKGFYTIEPVAEHDPLLEDAYPHILYKTDELDNSSVCHTMGEFGRNLSASLVRKRRESTAGLSLPLYVETLIVMDKTLTSHHPESDCENYILTVFNMADNLFHDASLGLMMSLTVVRMIRMEAENDEMNLRVNRNAEKTLKYFQNWQYEMNPGDDSHPNHHDVAVLVTKVNVCNSKTSCGLLGLTTIGKACDPKLSAALCEDNGLRLGHVIAHEIGHLLGADHDSDNSTSNGTDSNGLKTVMHPDISTTAQTWSSSSQAYFKAFLGSGMGNCLLDEPEEHHFNIQDLLPGVMYNADFQCKNLITDKARECDMGSNCESLNCFVPGYACIITHTPPADGTFCGENMWCHNTKCLVVGERPGAIDGNWGEWSAWSDCSRTCGSGVASSVRNCDKPQPSHGGKNCVGERKRYKICAAMEVNVSFVGKPCETGRPSFRDIQCGEFNDWIYPEDGKLHTWMAYFSHDDNPCILYCVNEEKQVAALKPRVVDGTMCFRGIRDICVGGICKSLPCDLHFESNAVEDACGICHGDGTGCEFSEGTETLSKLTKGLTKLVNIPSGTRNIKVEELSPTLAKIIVKDKDTREMYVRGTLGMFTVPGSQAWLGMIKKNQAALNIPGPVSKPLSIWIQRLDNVTVKWSMALPAEQQRKPEFAWDFLKWGPCSAKCGPGTQISKPSCMEGKAGLVEDTFCSDLEMPPTKVRQCEVTRCEPRWMVGDWKGCEQSNLKKQERKRIVYCIKPVGEGEGESQIVSDSQCIGPKPHESEPCYKRMKRKRNHYTNSNSPENNNYPFVSDTSEYGVRNKYEDYQRRFEAPQKFSQTIPPNVIFSPHFKHYFHLLENLPSGTRYEAQAQYDVSPDFYNTFSRRQVGVTHIQPNFQKSIRSLRKGSKKSLDWEYRQMHRKRSNYPLAERHSNWLMQLRHNRTASVAGIRDVENVLILKQRYNKAYNYTPSNLTITANPNESYRSSFADLIRKCRSNEMSSHEITKLKRLWNMLNSKYKEKKNMKHFLLFSKIRAEPEGSETFECNEIRKLINCHDKEIDESIAKLYQKVKNSYRGNQIQKESPSSNRGISLKAKRASLIWKKPKSKDGNSKLPKEQTGNGGGSESKNYLNNLFRDNHPKPPPSNKPPEIQSTLERPVIKEGLLVIDKDKPENQEMEILFDGEETAGKRRKFVNVPQLTRNERKITIKGQDVFNLFQEIQDQGDNRENSAFYRLENSHTEKLDINIKVPEPTSRPETTENTTISTTTAATKAPEKSSEATKEKQAEEKSSTSKPEDSKETKNEEESTNQDGNKEVKTVLETLSKTPESNSDDDSEGCDVDEEILDDSESSEKTEKEKKKEEKEEKDEEKKEKKKKKKEKKEKKKMEEKKKKEEKNKKKEEKKKKTKKKKEKKKKKPDLEDSDLDWVDLVWTGFPRNQEEKLIGHGCDIDDEIEEFLKCTEGTTVDIKDKKKEEKERKKEEKKRRKEEKKKKKKEEKQEKKKEKQMKKKMQTEELLTRALNLEDYMWNEFPAIQEKKSTDPVDSDEKEVGKNEQTKLFPESQGEMLPNYSNSDKEEIIKYDQKKLLHQNQEEKLPDSFDPEKEDVLKFDQRKLLLENNEEKLPDSFDPEKEDVLKFDQKKLLPENKEEKLPDSFDPEKQDVLKFDQEKLFPENMGEKQPDYFGLDKEEIFKHNQKKPLPENKEEKLPDYFDFDKEDIFKFDQNKLLPVNQGEKLPNYFDSDKEDIFKYDQRKLLPENQGGNQEEKRPDLFDSTKEEIEKFSQRILLPENQGGNWFDNFDSTTEDTDKYGQRKLLPEKQGEKRTNPDKDGIHKYDQRKLFAENREEKLPSHSDSSKEEITKYGQRKLLRENQGEKLPDYFDLRNEGIFQFVQRKLLPENQAEKLPDHFDSAKKENDKYDQKKPVPEKQGEKFPDHSDSGNEEVHKYEQRKLIPENQGQKRPDHFDSSKEEIVKEGQRKLIPENQGEKLPDHFDSSKEEVDKDGQRKLLLEKQEEKRPDHLESDKKEIHKDYQTKLLPKVQEERCHDHSNSVKQEIPKDDQKELLPETQEEKRPEHTDSGKEKTFKYEQRKLLHENQEEKCHDHSNSVKQEIPKDDQKKLLPESQGEKRPEHIDSGKEKIFKYEQRKLLHENQGEKRPDHSDSGKEEIYKYIQRKLFPENRGEKFPEHSDSGKEKIYIYDQRKLFPENLGEKLAIEASGNDDISKYLRSSEKKKKKQRTKEAKIIEKERRQEEKMKMEEGKKLKKKINIKIKDTRKMELRKKKRLPKQKTEHLANSDPKWIYLLGTVLPLNQEEKLTEQLDSGKEEEDNCDQPKPSTDKQEDVLGTNVCVDNRVSKRLRWMEKKNRKERMKQEKKFQKQREEEEKVKLEEGKRLKKLLIRKNKEKKHKALHKKFKPQKKKHSQVETSNVKWADLVRTAFPMNEEVRLTDHFDADKEETEKYHQRKLLPKNPEENLTLEDISECGTKSKNGKRKEEKAKAKQEKKEAKKKVSEGKRLEKILKKKEKIAKKRKLQVLKKLQGRKNQHLVDSDPDLECLLSSASPKNQEENFTGLGCDLDDEIDKYLKSTGNIKENKKEKENETNFGSDVDEQIAKYLKFAEKSKTEKEREDASDLGRNIDDEIEKYLQCMKAKNAIGIASDVDDKISTYFQCEGKTKKENKIEEKEQKKKKKEEEKSKKKDEKLMKKEEKKIGEELKKKRKKEKKQEKKEEKMRKKKKKKKKKKDNVVQKSVVDWKNLEPTDNQKEKLTADSEKEEKDNYDPNKPKTKLHDGL